MSKKLILCDCLGTQSLDADAIGKACGLTCSKVYTNLCEAEIEAAAQEIANGDAIVACRQEQARFEELADEVSQDVLGFVDLRDRAGWGTGDGTAKMAALAAEAAMELPIEKSVDVISEGTCLIIGGEEAIAAATDLCEILAVTVLAHSVDHAPLDRRFDFVVGQVQTATGALGGFEVKFQTLQQVILGGRGEISLTPAQNGAVSDCDIILDLSGETPLFSAYEKREGYVRADPKHPPSIAKAVLQASQLIGTFEKPLYVRLEPSICAHSRAEKPACSNCLSVCPTGAITSAGDHVAIDPMICAGCGSCSAVCPSGAISYDAPPVDTVFRRLSTLAATYRDAGGASPKLLVHDVAHGRPLIELGARFGPGLPGDVIPFEVEAFASFGHAEMLGALASGFAQVILLVPPKAERDVIAAQVELAHAVAGEEAVCNVDVADPDAMFEALDALPLGSVECVPILPMGTRRQITRQAAKTLLPEAEVIDLPKGAPYGAVLVDTEDCTLCLSCVSLCPSGALGDNSDLPQLRFQEDACLQCGLCANICPEKAIALQPQLTLTDDALSQKVLNEEEPFACIECGALFGVKSTVERITEKLAGTHSMFATSDAAKMIQMCDNCRIQANYHSENNPFQGGERPRVRTTADYFSDRKDH